MTLALDYRPRTFKDLIGQQPVRLVLQQMVKQDKLPPALLFTGSRGTGKTTTGRILAAALNCEQGEAGEPCTTCLSCTGIFDGSSQDVIEIDAASNGNIGDVRALADMVMYAVGGKYRVVLLDEAHSMSRDAMNALLKTLEEPPPGTVFILLTTEPGKIIDTVRSRCMEFDFRRIPTEAIQSRLMAVAIAEGYTSEAMMHAGYPELLQLIAERANGGMRDALMVLDQVSTVGVKNAEQFRKLMGISDYAPTLVGTLIAGDLPATFEQLDAILLRHGDPQAVATELVSCLRDLLVLSGGGQIARQGQPLLDRQNLLTGLEASRLLAAVRVLWDLRTKVRGGDDRSSLELALVMLSEALRGPQAQAQPETRTLSLEDMMSLAAPA